MIASRSETTRGTWRTVTAASLTLGIVAIATTLVVLAYLIYPAAPSSSRVMKFDGFKILPKAKTLNVLDYLTLSGPDLFVAGTSAGSVFKLPIDPSKRNERRTVLKLGGNAVVHGVAIVPSQKIAFFTNSGDNAVGFFDTASLKLLGNIPVADDADAILYDPRTNLIYVANGDANIATLIDPSRHKTVGVIYLHGKPEFSVLDPYDGLLYQNLQDQNALVAVDLNRRAVIGRWGLDPCEGPSGMAIDSEHRRLFSVCGKNATLVVFDLAEHHVIASMRIGGGPDSVAFDPLLKRLYSAGIAGKLTVIEQTTPDSYRVLDNIRTHYGAHTLAVDRVSHKVYVGYASLFTSPRIAVFSPLR